MKASHIVNSLRFILVERLKHSRKVNERLPMMEGTQMRGGMQPHTRLGGIDERLPVRLSDIADERNHAMAMMPLIYCANSSHRCKFFSFHVVCKSKLNLADCVC